jgi:hypothetical protein
VPESCLGDFSGHPKFQQVGCKPAPESVPAVPADAQYRKYIARTKVIQVQREALLSAAENPSASSVQCAAMLVDNFAKRRDDRDGVFRFRRLRFANVRTPDGAPDVQCMDDFSRGPRTPFSWKSDPLNTSSCDFGTMGEEINRR